MSYAIIILFYFAMITQNATLVGKYNFNPCSDGAICELSGIDFDRSDSDGETPPANMFFVDDGGQLFGQDLEEFTCHHEDFEGAAWAADFDPCDPSDHGRAAFVIERNPAGMWVANDCDTGELCSPFCFTEYNMNADFANGNAGPEALTYVASLGQFILGHQGFDTMYWISLNDPNPGDYTINESMPVVADGACRISGLHFDECGSRLYVLAGDCGSGLAKIHIYDYQPFNKIIPTPQFYTTVDIQDSSQIANALEGITVDDEGFVLVVNDSNGIMYRVCHQDLPQWNFGDCQAIFADPGVRNPPFGSKFGG